MKKLIVILTFVMLVILSCDEQGSFIPNMNSPITTRNFDYDDLRESLSNYTEIVRGTSKWLATEDARAWIIDLKARKARPLDEILLLEVLCSEEGDSFISSYNYIATTDLTKSGLIQIINTYAPLICIKIDYFIEPFINSLDDYDPLVCDFDFENAYLNGTVFDEAEDILHEEEADLVIFFRVTLAYNTVLYNPSQETFEPSLEDFLLCDNGQLYDELAELGNQICSGEIPLSIGYDILELANEFCGAPPINAVEICDNDIDDDDDELIDCADPDCCGFQNCNCDEEICNNDLDDDGDGLVDEDDPDCFTGTSPCMRDHYLEDNFFYEFEVQSPQQLGAWGQNICGGYINLVTPSATTIVGNWGTIYASIGSTTKLEEWYDFLVKIHWGSATGETGFFQDIAYRFNIFELTNNPEFTLSIYHAGQAGTGGSGGVAILTIISQGLTETIPVSLGPILFYAISDVCGVNNWDPGALGDKVRISIHEFDNCTLNTTTGEVSVSTTTRSYNSEIQGNYGLGAAAAPITGGVLFKNSTQYASNHQNTVSSSYQTNWSNDYHLGSLNYSYCWTDQQTQVQIHQMPYGNLAYLRMSSEICD